MQITPTQFLESINALNEKLISAHSLRHSFLDNMLAVFSLQLSKLFWTSHYEKATPVSLERLSYTHFSSRRMCIRILMPTSFASSSAIRRCSA